MFEAAMAPQAAVASSSLHAWLHEMRPVRRPARARRAPVGRTHGLVIKGPLAGRARPRQKGRRASGEVDRLAARGGPGGGGAAVDRLAPATATRTRPGGQDRIPGAAKATTTAGPVPDQVVDHNDPVTW